MRIKLTFEKVKEGDIVFPSHYNHLLQSFIYKNISKELAIFLHDKGFEYEKRKFKMFVFSRVFSEKFKFLKNKIKFGRKIYFYVSSPLNEFLSQFAENLLKKSEFKIYENELILREVYVLPIIEPESKVNIKMLSPVTVYSTFYKSSGIRDSGIGKRKENGIRDWDSGIRDSGIGNGELSGNRESGFGRKKTYYYSPYEKEFEILIKENLRKKYESFYKEKKEFVFKIKPLKVDKNQEKIIIYKGTVIKGWLGVYEIESEKEIIKFAYDTGLGSKNSQGFGMFEVQGAGIGRRDSGSGFGE